ncbi:uncharacterized protein LOC100763051 isoform X2 [Cricetulus griseus]|uniref:Uncharacterized protein LOC100763051 isoform X2 n=1 Tax=Cricetulus griseus TaxID=10029 RepID=A0A9J7GK02_CRIGR|nr:uncharacterized protein LOC100763051 isoform X2 [Cricetulus griseus]
MADFPPHTGTLGAGRHFVRFLEGRHLADTSGLRKVSLAPWGYHHSPEGSTSACWRRSPFSIVNPAVVSSLKDLGPGDPREAPQLAIHQGL